MNKSEFYKEVRERQDKSDEAFRLKIKEREQKDKVYDSIKRNGMSFKIENK